MKYRISLEFITPLAIFWKWKFALKYCRKPTIALGIKYRIKSVNKVSEKHIAMPIIKAITWFLVNRDAKMPIDENVAPKRIAHR